MRPCWQLSQHVRDGLIKQFEVIVMPHPLAVGGIGDQTPEASFAGDRLHGHCLKVNVRCNPRPLSIFSSRFQCSMINVTSQQFFFQWFEHDCVSSLSGCLPHVSGEVSPCLTGEFTMASWGHVSSDTSCLNRNGAAAAKGVNQGTSRTPETQQHHGCGQRFFQRSLGNVCAITPAVQAAAGGVERQSGNIFQNRDVNLVFRTSFRQFFGLVISAQGVDNSAFDCALTGWNTRQR